MLEQKSEMCSTFSIIAKCTSKLILFSLCVKYCAMSLNSCPRGTIILKKN